MTSWEARPAFQREPANATQSRASGFAGTLRRQFREIARRLTARNLEPRPKPRRRRAGDAGRGFRVAAIALLGRVTRIPLFHTLNPRWDTFTWLRLWEYNDTVGATSDQDCVPPAPPPSIGPHP